MTTSPLLECRGITAGYGGGPVISDVNVSVGHGEIVALLGRNGVGKTTLLKTISGILRPISGSVRYDGQLLRGPLHQRVRQGLGVVTEERAIIRSLTARENLLLASRKSIDKAVELFPELAPLLPRKAGLLSGGEQQILVLARLLASGARLLLVDELSFGLAPQVVERLLSALRDAANAGTSTLVVEQQPEIILRAADRGYVLANGQVQLDGSSNELMERMRDIESAYLGLQVASPVSTENRPAASRQSATNRAASDSQAS